jgi:hypothetical protein
LNKGNWNVKKTFEEIQAELGNPVVGLPSQPQGRRALLAMAAKEGAQEEKNRWRYVFERIPAAQQKMATVLLTDRRCNMTPDEIVEACNIGRAPATPATITAAPLSDDTPSLTQEQELGLIAVKETARLLGVPVPATMRELPRAIPRAGQGWQIDPALRAAAEDLNKNLGPLVCQR